MIVLDALGSPLEAGGADHGRQVGDVAATGGLGDGIPAGKAKVAGPLELDQQGIDSLPGNLTRGGAEEPDMGAALEGDQAGRRHRDGVYRAGAEAGCAFQTDGGWRRSG